MPGTSFPAAILAVFVAAAQLLCPEAQQDFTTGQIPNPFTIGDSYPDRTEVAVCRPIEDYIDRNSARFSNELVTNTNNARIIFTGADTRIMSSRLLSRLNALAATYHSATGSRLRVLKAWTESGDPDVSDDRSLHFEGEYFSCRRFMFHVCMQRVINTIAFSKSLVLMCYKVYCLYACIDYVVSVLCAPSK